MGVGENSWRGCGKVREVVLLGTKMNESPCSQIIPRGAIRCNELGYKGRCGFHGAWREALRGNLALKEDLFSLSFFPHWPPPAWPHHSVVCGPCVCAYSVLGWLLPTYPPSPAFPQRKTFLRRGDIWVGLRWVSSSQVKEGEESIGQELGTFEGKTNFSIFTEFGGFFLHMGVRGQTWNSGCGIWRPGISQGWR